MAIDPAAVEMFGNYQKAADLNTHVRLLEIDNVSVVEIRDYIPSLNEYGRGYWIPATKDAVNDTMASLQAIVDSGKLN